MCKNGVEFLSLKSRFHTEKILTIFQKTNISQPLVCKTIISKENDMSPGVLSSKTCKIVENFVIFNTFGSTFLAITFKPSELQSKFLFHNQILTWACDIDSKKYNCLQTFVVKLIFFKMQKMRKLFSCITLSYNISKTKIVTGIIFAYLDSACFRHAS